MRRAKVLSDDLSEVLDAARARAVEQVEHTAWLAENEAAIEDYNAKVVRRGTFGEAWRRF